MTDTRRLYTLSRLAASSPPWSSADAESASGRLVAGVHQLDVDGPATAAFLVHRYTVSATAAPCVATVGIAGTSSPERAALLGVAARFAVRGMVALLGLASGDVGGLAWVAVVADPVLAVGCLGAGLG